MPQKLSTYQKYVSDSLPTQSRILEMFFFKDSAVISSSREFLFIFFLILLWAWSRRKDNVSWVFS